MIDGDVPEGEMPRLPFPHRFGDKADSTQLEALLGAGSIDAAASGEWADVSQVLQAAAAPATPSELAAEPAILAAFQRAQLGAPSRRRRPLVRPRMLTTLLTGKIAAALACAAVGATGAATAAYADALPDSVQNIAHTLIAAPPAHSHASDTGREHGHQFALASASPSASAAVSGSASASTSTSASASTSASTSASASASASATPDDAFGLCTAWSNAVRHGLQNQVGFRDKLAGIAGGADNITTFCATVKPHVDASESESPESDSPEPSKTESPDGAEHHGNSDHGKSHGDEGGSIPTVSLSASADS